MFGGDGRIGNADEVCPRIVETVGGPETGAQALVGKFAVIVAEARLDDVEAGACVDGVDSVTLESCEEFVLGRDLPTGGADGLGGFVELVEPSKLRAVIVVVVVAVVALGSVEEVQVFGHPHLTFDSYGLVGLFGALQRVCTCVIFAGMAAGVACGEGKRDGDGSECDEFGHGCLLVCMLNLYGRHQQYGEYLAAQYAEQHGERVDGCVSDVHCFAVGLAVGEGECGRVGGGAREYTAEREVVHLECEVADGRDNGERQEGDECRECHVVHSVSVEEHVEELDACIETDTAQEQRESEFAEHEVRAVRHEEVERPDFALAAQDNRDDERAASKPELERRGHSGDGDGDASGDDAEKDPEECGEYFGMVERGERVPKFLGGGLDAFLRSDKP